MPATSETRRGVVTGFTHVSVGARDLDESVRFYGELFGLEEIPHPEFPFEVRWMRVGDLQLHLFASEDEGLHGHHFALDVWDFGVVWERAGRMEVRVEEGSFGGVRELPDGAVQAYVRDPSGNLVEINHPDASTLDRTSIPEVRKFEGGPDVALYMERRDR